MKRGMVGGAYRGPVGVGRQRRTIRFVQILLVLMAAGLMMYAGYSMGRRSGFDDGRRAGDIDAPTQPAASQTFVVALLGLGALGAAIALQTDGGVRLLTPARLRELEEMGGQPIALEEDAADLEKTES